MIIHQNVAIEVAAMVKFVIIHQNAAVEVTTMVKFMIIHQNVAIAVTAMVICCHGHMLLLRYMSWSSS